MPNVGGGVSIERLQKTFKNCVSILVSKNQSQEINKPVRTWTTESACVFVYVYAKLYNILIDL